MGHDAVGGDVDETGSRCLMGLHGVSAALAVTSGCHNSVGALPAGGNPGTSAVKVRGGGQKPDRIPGRDGPEACGAPLICGSP